jgi:hypothetical protein
MTPLTKPELATIAPKFQPEPRSYTVTFKRDLRPGWGLDWHLHTAGGGHWCVGGRQAGAFRSETEAHSAGRRWVETGRVA